MKEKNGRGTASQGINTHDSQLSKEERSLEKEKITSSVSDTLKPKVMKQALHRAVGN